MRQPEACKTAEKYGFLLNYLTITLLQKTALALIWSSPTAMMAAEV